MEVWDLGGTRGAKQLKKLADNPSQVIGNSRFLGRAEIPLVDTLTSTQRGQCVCLCHKAHRRRLMKLCSWLEHALLSSCVHACAQLLQPAYQHQATLVVTDVAAIGIE